MDTSSYSSSSSSSANSSSSSSSIDSSSSSSSSSIDSSSSSSSSSEGKMELFFVSIQQQNHNLLPFSLFVEKGISKSDLLKFEIDASSTFLDFSTLIKKREKNEIDDESPTHVPHESLVDHESSFYIELMAKDMGGIKKYNLRSQEELYGYETPYSTFNVPKFSWSNDLFFTPPEDSESEDDSKDINNTLWVGDDSLQISALKYDNESIQTLSQIKLMSEPHKLLWKRGSNDIYVTQTNLLEEYYAGDEGSVSKPSNSILNPNRDIITFSGFNYLWTCQPYSGSVVKRNPSNWEVIDEYIGFDAPRKMRWSPSHNALFVAGTNVLWKLQDGMKSSVYEIDGYKIVDFDVSERGYVSIVFGGENEDLIRILGPDLFSIKFNEFISQEYDARHTIYCERGIFYALVESFDDKKYSFLSYIFDTTTGTKQILLEDASIVDPVEKIDPIIPTKKVEVVYPVGEEKISQGDAIDILWASVESASDQIKIDLLKDNKPHSAITFSTNNSGVYKWLIPSSLENGSNYQIKLTWVSATEIENNTDTSNAFTISNIPDVETPSVTTSVYRSAGIGFNQYKKHVVNVLSNGCVGYVDLNDLSFYGLFKGDFKADGSNVTCMTVKQNSFENYIDITAVRVFVGSEMYYSDKWDSGVVETNKTEIYYGGGNNLTPGETYYVNVQVNDAVKGWSGVQTKEWVMPK